MLKYTVQLILHPYHVSHVIAVNSDHSLTMNVIISESTFATKWTEVRFTVKKLQVKITAKEIPSVNYIKKVIN